MNDLSNKSSEELAAELRKKMPILKSRGFGWRGFLNLYTVDTDKNVCLVSQLVLAQQREIEQLKAELDELKKR